MVSGYDPIRPIKFLSFCKQIGNFLQDAEEDDLHPDDIDIPGPEPPKMEDGHGVWR